MPPAIIAAIIGAAVTATTTGLELSGVGRPDSPKAPAPGPQPLTTGQNQQQQAAVSQQLPNLQSLTGGSLSPEYAAQFGALQSGVGNDPQASGNVQAAINQFFGLTAPGQTGLTSSTGTGGGNPLADLLKTPLSGGTSPPPGGGYGPWIQQAINGNEFRGLQG
jgi:hypothetical protein